MALIAASWAEVSTAACDWHCVNARMTFAARSGPIRCKEASADSSIGEELPVASLVAVFSVHASVAICQEAVGRCSVDAVERAKKSAREFRQVDPHQYWVAHLSLNFLGIIAQVQGKLIELLNNPHQLGRS